MTDYLSYLLLNKNRILFIYVFTVYVVWRPTPNVVRSFAARHVSVVCKQLTSF